MTSLQNKRCISTQCLLVDYNQILHYMNLNSDFSLRALESQVCVFNEVLKVIKCNIFTGLKMLWLVTSTACGSLGNHLHGDFRAFICAQSETAFPFFVRNVLWFAL